MKVILSKDSLSVTINDSRNEVELEFNALTEDEKRALGKAIMDREVHESDLDKFDDHTLKNYIKSRFAPSELVEIDTWSIDYEWRA